MKRRSRASESAFEVAIGERIPVGQDVLMTDDQCAATIPVRSAGNRVEALAEDLDRQGCLVVTDAMSDDKINALRSEMAPHMESAKIQADQPDAFYPGLTRRVTALVARSETARELVLDPVGNALARHHLGSSCEHHQLHVTAALEIGPGARPQILHREEDPFSFFPLPRPNLILATMWAISDFTADNGGTLLVPGSHRWSADRTARPDEIVTAEMPAGSVLFWLGGTLHGAGANVTETQWRYGVILTYSLGWLRQEENQSLDIPLAQLDSLTPELRQLTGHAMHGSLGFFDPAAVRV